MTEKEFKKVLNDYEYSVSDKAQLLDAYAKINTVVTTYLPQQFEVLHFELVGAFANNLLIKGQKHLDIAIVVSVKKAMADQTLLKVITNELENALYFSEIENITIERNANNLKITYSNDIIINLIVKLLNNTNELYDYGVECNRVKIIDNINEKYTLYKNTLRLIKYYEKTESIKNINSYLIAILLAYSLERYNSENKYYSYLNSLTKGIDDFTGGKKIELLHIYDGITKTSKYTIPTKYQVIDPVAEELNVAGEINDLGLGEYRKLRKKLAKEAELTDDSDFVGNSTTEVAININPFFDETKETYAWQYSIIGKNIKNSGGEDKNLQTAILKGLFKGLKTLLDKGLVKKKIYIYCDTANVLGDEMLTSDENKSRMKTIKALIKNNDLNVIQK